MPQRDEDTYAPYDDLVAAADREQSPWTGATYVPDRDLLRTLLAIPIKAGHAKKQKSGRTAKAVDVWVAHELRRAGFAEDEVCPRMRSPRFIPSEMAPVVRQIETALDRLAEEEKKLQAAGDGKFLKPVSFRNAVAALRGLIPGSSKTAVLGRFYRKEIDVLISGWQHGPDVIVSTKTQFSSYLNNKNNRYEEAIGEATNLRDRYPLTALGYVYVVRSNIFKTTGAYAFIRDLLVRLRKPDGPFDATMMLVADWEDETLALNSVEDAAETLSAAGFFQDLIGALLENTPVTVHTDVRERRDGTPPGGLPPEDVADEDDDD